MRPRLIRDEYDDQGDYVPKSVFRDREVETPFDMAHRQAGEARQFLKKIAAGGHLNFPWPDLHRVIGPLLPGWMVAVGGRAKAGKTTFLRELLTAWVESRKTIVYVGTETEAGSLRLAWAAIRSRLPAWEGLTPSSPENAALVQADLSRQVNDLSARAIFGEIGEGTVEELAYWMEYARVAKADALIFDHIHRLEVTGTEHWEGMGKAVRKIKNMARDSQLLVVAGAQLKGVSNDPLSEHEVPGNGSWAETANIQREADVAIQVWKPLKPGVSHEQKRAAREDGGKKLEIIQQGAMGIRVAAHRWRGDMADQYVRLFVENDQISSWSNRA